MLLSFDVRKSREMRQKLRRYVESREGFIKSKEMFVYPRNGKINEAEKEN